MAYLLPFLAHVYVKYDRCKK